MSDNRYNQRGVSASKEDVHAAIKNIDKGIFPQASCKIIPDILGADENYCNIMHADGAGTKSSLAYTYWKETGDISVWKGIAQDAVIMNMDDLICVGATNNILLSSTIGRNKGLITGEVISALINGTEEVLQNLRDNGIDIPQGHDCLLRFFISRKFIVLQPCFRKCIQPLSAALIEKELLCLIGFIDTNSNIVKIVFLTSVRAVI